MSTRKRLHAINRRKLLDLPGTHSIQFGVLRYWESAMVDDDDNPQITGGLVHTVFHQFMAELVFKSNEKLKTIIIPEQAIVEMYEQIMSLKNQASVLPLAEMEEQDD